MSSATPTPPLWENPVKALLRQGKPAIGVTVTVNHVETAAQAAALGFDFLLIQAGSELNLMATGARALLEPLGRWKQPGDG